ncbi:hypothetical protein KIPB_003339 [Kipferlia bialata]|uniref:Uncharacterized protein n=1 Tax=Kipferlia bialata TaxID=797122 RepID=A0A9K3CTX0_9EUKA|nr:hypothetical protein KIPB_003339 [Kipferlia bialata]|eukprot:g3339.t1
MVFSCMCGGDKQEKAAAERNKKVNQYLRQHIREESETVKVLLLGPGGSGKSTIFRQVMGGCCLIGTVCNG